MIRKEALADLPGQEKVNFPTMYCTPDSLVPEIQKQILLFYFSKENRKTQTKKVLHLIMKKNTMIIYTEE